MTEPYEGMWDFSGACAPSKDGSRKGQGDTFTLGCFWWVKASRGKKLYHGNVQIRFKGMSHDPAPTYEAAEAYCAMMNAGRRAS